MTTTSTLSLTVPEQKLAQQGGLVEVARFSHVSKCEVEYALSSLT
jgi:hypothetical protein